MSGRLVSVLLVESLKVGKERDPKFTKVHRFIEHRFFD